MPWVNYKELLQTLVPIFIRALGVFAFLPFGSDLSGVLQKFTLALALSIFVILKAPFFPAADLIALPFEFLIGICLVIPALLMIELAAMFGELFDVGRGQTIAQVYDPLSFTQASLMSQFSRYFIIALLLVSGLLEKIWCAFDASFEVVKPGGYPLSALPQLGAALLAIEFQFLKGMFSAFLPIGLGFLTIEFCFGIVAKALPQVNLPSEPFQVKALFSFLFLLVILGSQLEPALFGLAIPRLDILRAP